MLARLVLFLVAWLFATAAANGAASDAGFPILDEPEGQHNVIGGPVMAIERSAGGQLFIGSNRLAIYDGVTWQRVILPGALRVFSLASTRKLPPGVAPAEERIWLGGDNAVGYLRRDATGEWLFVSLHAQFTALGLGEPSELRGVFPTADGAVFVSRSRVMRWDGTKFTVWELPSANRLFGFMHEGRILVYQTDIGLLRIDADGPKLVMDVATLPVRQPLVSLVRCADGSDFAVFYDDIFRLADGQWTRHDALTALIKGRRALQAVAAGPNMIAIGTAYGGVVLSRTDGNLLGVVSVQNGLGEDNVNSLLSDSGAQLWIGTGTGLSRLSGVGRASLFDQRNHLSTGITRAVRLVDHRPWIVTSRRAYRLETSMGLEPALVSRVERFWPVIRDVTVFRNELWLGGAGGIWRLAGSEPVHELATEKDVYLLSAPHDLPDGLLYADGFALTARVEEQGRWRSIPLGITLDSSPVTTLEDGRHRLWISTRSGNIHVFQFEPGGRKLREELHFSPGHGLPAGTARPVLSLVGGEVVALTETGVLARRDGRFTLVGELASFIANGATNLPDGTAYWTALCRDLGDAAPLVLLHVRRDPASGRFEWTPLAVPGLNQIGTVARLSYTADVEQRVLWVGGESALLRLEADQLGAAAEPPATTLQRLRIDSRHDASLGVNAPAFAAGTSQLEFAFAASIDSSEVSSLFFQTRLAGVETAWSAPRGLTRREFTGLAPGAYTFQARMIDGFGRTGAPANFDFSIEAPWYQRTWAVALWLALAGMLVWVSVKWRLRRMQGQADRLNRLVGERTRELSLSNAARSEFLDSLSHEIRRPLNGILALTARLAQDRLTGAQQEQVRQLQLGSESLLRVFNEVLNFSQLEYGAVPLEEREFRLGHVIDAVRVECDAATALTVNLPPDFPDGFLGDDAKLKSIVANFVANALKYAPGSPVEIHVTSTPAARDTADVLIEVIDGGPGVPAEEQELIFKRFVRGSRAKQAHVPGTGIGLATCRAMARLMGGSVGVESPVERAREHGWPGPGAMFFVRVPLRRRAIAEPAAGSARL